MPRSQAPNHLHLKAGALLRGLARDLLGPPSLLPRAAHTLFLSLSAFLNVGFLNSTSLIWDPRKKTGGSEFTLEI